MRFASDTDELSAEGVMRASEADAAEAMKAPSAATAWPANDAGLSAKLASSFFALVLVAYCDEVTDSLSDK